MENNNEKEEVLFENEFTASVELYKEYVRALAFPKLQYISLFMAIIIGMIAIGSINEALTKGGSVASAILYSLLTVVLIIEIPIQRYRVLKTAIRQEKTMYNGEMGKRNLKFYQDRLESGNGMKIPYSNITKIRKSKNCIILVANKATGVMVKKDAFIKGSYEDFMQFMHKVTRK